MKRHRNRHQKQAIETNNRNTALERSVIINWGLEHNLSQVFKIYKFTFYFNFFKCQLCCIIRLLVIHTLMRLCRKICGFVVRIWCTTNFRVTRSSHHVLGCIRMEFYSVTINRQHLLNPISRLTNFGFKDLIGFISRLENINVFVISLQIPKGRSPNYYYIDLSFSICHNETASVG